MKKYYIHKLLITKKTISESSTKNFKMLYLSADEHHELAIFFQEFETDKNNNIVFYNCANLSRTIFSTTGWFCEHNILFIPDCWNNVLDKDSSWPELLSYFEVLNK